MTTATTVGLGLDLLGAVLLAVPELPLVRSLTRAGKLRQARAALGGAGVCRGDTGFALLLERVCRTEPVQRYERLRPDDVERVVHRSRAPDEVTESAMDDLQWGTMYIELQGDGDPDYLQVDYYDPATVFEEVTVDIDSTERLFRTVGLVALMMGFLLQIIQSLGGS